MSERTVLVLDDNREFRESTAWLLESMDYHVEHFGDPHEAIEALAALRRTVPSCLLLDIRMPVMSGLDVHDVLNERALDVPVIYMTAHGDVPLAVNAMRKGALTFLQKPLEPDTLEAAIEQALSPQVQHRRGSRVDRETVRLTRERLAALSPRELQIIGGLVNDRTNREMAEEFSISVKTVELYRSKAMRKLEARNAAHLVKLVMSCDGAQAPSAPEPTDVPR